MPTQLQLRRGTTAQNNAFTGAAGELSYDTTIDTIRVHDGTTAGGYELTMNSATQTLTNKTLTTPVISSISNTGTLTLPTSTDTLVGRATTDTLTNKTLTAPVISTISNTGTLTLPTSTDTLVGRATTDTLTNKTLTSPTISAPTITGNATGVNLTLSGDLTVNGTTTTVSSTNTVISDNLIELNNGAASNANDSGIVIERGSTGDNAFMGWDESADKFIVGTTTATGASTGDLTITSGTLVAATFEGALSGNASTASAWATGRTITLTGDVTGASGAFDGSGNLSFATTIAANSVALGTDTTGNYVAAGAVSGVGLSGSSSSEGGTFTVTSNATSANTASTIVARDGSGNFSAGVVTATATQARYADLAERYSSDSDYGFGTVLIFGGEEEVTQSTSQLSKRIAGVVSVDPAYLMNSELQGGVNVALVGRVPCKVVGPVTKGDMMVSSAIPGHAQAWHEEGDPPMGTVIGKALENKTGSGEDVIEVVVGRI